MDPFVVLELLYGRGVNEWERLHLGVRGRVGVVVGLRVVVVVVDEWFNGSLDVGQQRTLVGILGEEGRGRGWGWQAFTEWQALRIWHLTCNTENRHSSQRILLSSLPPTYESFVGFLSLPDVALHPEINNT